MAFFRYRIVEMSATDTDKDEQSVKDGHLIITSKWDESFPFHDGKDGSHYYGKDNNDRPVKVTTGAIIGRNHFLHGYLETRCKAAF
ncbi:MAG: hypothetical protein QNK83_13125 [Akkermansiaceae bacterium]